MRVLRWSAGVVFAGLLCGDFAVGQASPNRKPLPRLGKVSLLDAERRKLATNIAGFVANEIKMQPKAPRVMVGRRLLGLAYALDGNSREAILTKTRVVRGLDPTKVELDYTSDSLVRILVARALSLQKKGGKENLRVAGFFLGAALEVQPRNEEVVYQYELHRLDFGEVDWTPLLKAYELGRVVPAEEEKRVEPEAETEAR